MRREVARAEVRALTDAMMDAVGVTLYAPDLPPDAIGKGLQDVVEVFTSEIERRIPGWTDADPTPIEETSMQLSEQDQKAVELAKMTRRNPALKERMAKADERNAERQAGPVEKQHPVSKMAADSPVLAEYEAEVLDVMSKDRCSHELALGKISRDPAYHDLKRRYRDEQRALRGA
jgi:hypothetical protein